MKDIIGTTAGRIWEYLYKHGTSTVIKIKASLGISNSLMYLALGWLAREDKIEVSESGHTFKVALKE